MYDESGFRNWLKTATLIYTNKYAFVPVQSRAKSRGKLQSDFAKSDFFKTLGTFDLATMKFMLRHSHNSVAQHPALVVSIK